MSVRKTLALLAVAVFVALLGGAAAWDLRDNLYPPRPPATEEFLVAVADMEPGMRITNLDTQFREQPFISGTQPAKAMQKTDILAKPDKLIGRILVRPLATGEAITERHLKDDSVPERLRPGARAVSVPVRIYKTLASYQFVGIHVDLIGSRTEDQRLVSRLLVQDVPVLAT